MLQYQPARGAGESADGQDDHRLHGVESSAAPDVVFQPEVLPDIGHEKAQPQRDGLPPAPSVRGAIPSPSGLRRRGERRPALCDPANGVGEGVQVADFILE